ncbi:zinc dependent phospholipase C family protein [Caenimonas sedimenti]|uniref:Zinc dependent phospholipase C family protein n=1 Tax=Caenimonas sedimenti TaxID=2596921 RepID=A0A562ZHJ7_9BURK|nr:zinc dependent phospholipase C family protein [Caenimonas sedimenti]TWO68069.1 zinc dependent phospholipase C family protein [Caenimonas sedimenti]
MPGAYAHLSVVNDAQKLAESAGLRDDTLYHLGVNLKFVELGAVSPDYPYLALKSGQKKWADNMHYTNTAKLMQAAVAAIPRLPQQDQGRATAWLLGFAAHIATDMTIHPVVELRVGPYQGNESEHRRCEMHQDAFIFPRVMDVGETGLSEHLASGIATCHAFDDKDALDFAVRQVWMEMLEAAYPDQGAAQDASPDAWHSGFRGVLKAMAGINHLFPIARHVSTKLNLTYPTEAEIDDSFISQLRTPEGPMDYEAIYERAHANVLMVWKGLDDALEQGGSDALDRLENWNLDTGRSVRTGKLVFWAEA